MSREIACDLTVFSDQERKAHGENTKKVMKTYKDIRELAEGISFGYEYAEDRFVGLAKWVTQECKCCPFLAFDLRVEPGDLSSTIWLTIGGTPEIKRFVAMNFRRPE